MSISGSDIASEHGITRSPHWHSVEKDFIAKNPICAASGVTTGLQAHHVVPFHYCILLGRPELELDERNLITLSESEKGISEVNYHLLVGHANNFRSSNLNVRADAKALFGKTDVEIRSDSKWILSVSKRVKAWDQMTDSDKKELRDLMDTLYPISE